MTNALKLPCESKSSRGNGAAQRPVLERLTVDAKALAGLIGISVGILPQPIDAFEIETLILTTDFHHRNIGLYARAVRDFAKRRVNAQLCLRRYIELTGVVPERIKLSERGTARADRRPRHKTRRVIRCG
ncbi:MAG: hypothetical protein AABZ47_07265 [Planctomycetota bacterium]